MRRAWTLALALLTLTAPLLALPPAEAARATVAGEIPLPASSDGEPNGLVGSSAAAVGDAIYLFGGRLRDSAYSDAIYRFDPATSATTEVGRLPAVGTDPGGRQSGAAVALNGKIYYFGGAGLVQVDLNGDGTTETVPRALRDVVEFNPATGEAVKLLDELPAGAWGLAVARWTGSSGDVAYLFGGFSFDIANPGAIERLDTIVRFTPSKAPGTRIESLAARLPYPVQDAAAAALGNRIYLLGGLSDHEPTVNPCPTQRIYDEQTGGYREEPYSSCTTDRIIAFDPVAEQVRDYSGKLPHRAQFLSAGVHRGRAYVPGGRLSDGTASAAIVEFTPGNADPVRTLVPTLPQGVFGAPVAADSSGVLYVFGGRTGGISDLLATVVRLDPRATAPDAPRSFAVAPVAGGVRLTWEPPAYDGDAPVSAYRLYRAEVGAEPQLLAELGPGVLSHPDSTGRPGVEYVYRLSAVNSAGESVAAVATRVTDATVPGPVQDLRAYPGNREVVLRWAAPAETGGANVTGYRVYRDDALVQSIPALARSYQDVGLENGRAYRYSVRAVNVKGEGAAGAVVPATPAAVPDTPPAFTAAMEGAAVRLAWQPPTQPYDRFVVYRGDVPARLEPVANVTDLEWRDEAVERGRTYYYAAAAANAIGESPPTNVVAVSLVTRPGPPQSVFAAPLEGAVRITWQAPFDTGEADPSALTYYVSRRDPGSDRFRILDTGELRGTSYVDARVTPGVEYVYTVTTLNPLASDPSEQARATPRAVANRLPTAFLEAVPFASQPGDEVVLDASKSSDPDGTVARYVFDFGDGSEPLNTTEARVNHTFQKDGFYSVRLVVLDNRGDASEPVTRTLQVGTPSERPDPGTEDGDDGTPTPTGGSPPPGTKTPRIPGPGALAVLAALGVAALGARLRRRG